MSLPATTADAPKPETIKTCACGAKYSRDAWGALEYLGRQDDGTEIAELRLCVRCHSTIAVVIGPSTGTPS